MPVPLDWFEETMHIQVLFSDVLEISLQKNRNKNEFSTSHYLPKNPVTFLLYNVWNYYGLIKGEKVENCTIT